MKIQDVMTRNVATCNADDSLAEAAKIMWECDCGCVPVVDTADAVCGMITDRDVCMAAYTQGRPLHAIPVRSAMSSDVHRCRPGDAIEDVLFMMQQAKIRRAPVIDGDRLVGIVSLRDLLARSSDSARREPALRPELLLQTLVVITEPNGDGASDAIRDGFSSNRAELR